ncbi:kinase-like domain-containing protein [Trametes maxima]|nr:kinase-like domain-containing protein [Trametes maxima]
MSAPTRQKRLPNYVYLSEENVEHYTQSTLKGNYNLVPSEVFWRERQQFLLDHGYILRPRYRPDWRPSWLGTNLRPTFCEDSILLVDYQVMDARCKDNDEIVAIKTFRRDSQEMHIAGYLSALRYDPQNHSVPIHRILDDPHDSSLSLMVMPYLRPCNDPDFTLVGEIIEFINQTLEGLTFMHRHHIAHRDIAAENIMMDAKAMYPEGHHPVRLDYTPDAIYQVTPLPRIGLPIHYYYIDFGLACQFSKGESHYVIGDVGRDAEVPELSSTIPYDAFKVDIYALGNLYAKEFEKKYTNTQFLVPLIERMTQQRPDLRPTAQEALTQWYDIRDSLSESMPRWKLAPRSEAAIGRMLTETVAVAWEGINHLKKYVR